MRETVCEIKSGMELARNRVPRLALLLTALKLVSLLPAENRTQNCGRKNRSEATWKIWT
jgi:hypothetical protein